MARPPMFLPMKIQSPILSARKPSLSVSLRIPTTVKANKNAPMMPNVALSTQLWLKPLPLPLLRRWLLLHPQQMLQRPLLHP